MNLYKKYLSLHLKSELEYKTSFIMSFITQSIILFFGYFTVISLFNKFNSLKEYTVYEIMIVHAIIQFGFAVNKVFSRGFDNLNKLISSGDLDRILTRPRNIYLQILGWDIEYARISRILESIIILIIGIIKINITWTPLKALTILLMLISSVIIFFCIYIIGASFCFVTIEGIEVRHVFTDGGKEMAQYPINIYQKYFKIFFTFIIPFAFVNYYPLLYLLDTKNNHLYSISPLLTFLFIIPSILIFNQCLKKYSSAGS